MTPALLSALLEEQARQTLALERRLQVVLRWAGVANEEPDTPGLGMAAQDTGPVGTVTDDGTWRPGLPQPARGMRPEVEATTGSVGAAMTPSAMSRSIPIATLHAPPPAATRKSPGSTRPNNAAHTEPLDAPATTRPARNDARPLPRARLTDVLGRLTAQPDPSGSSKDDGPPQTLPAPTPTVEAVTATRSHRPTPADWSSAEVVTVTAEAVAPAGPMHADGSTNRIVPSASVGSVAPRTPVGGAARASHVASADHIWPDPEPASTRMSERARNWGFPDASPSFAVEALTRSDRADPFGESALEEAMADALERAALEAGIDLT